ncbi:DUF58 domain-containing protein [Enteractinococcus fodinae]|uniref:Uncharacterized protein (DUF58 family) n=1 Tax=Enteractinococcus fodinae TaxID=684663 RepID=A0ABU2AZD7_9MICC|nr:DUF58 domain-containing protein [Enteractinococcus fodinae]MDR7346720.1 uncharacterized protein (DUF58 family) [Enteractinococcus fodinae]
MFVSSRFVLLAAIGFVPMVLWPSWGTVFALVGLLALVLAIELSLTPSPRAVAIRRSDNKQVRLDTPLEVWVEVSNRARRRMRGHIRDGWQPSAHADQPLQALNLAPGSTQRFTTVVTPSRRGTVRTGKLTIRTTGPLGLAGRQYTHALSGEVTVVPPFRSRRHLPSRIQQLREIDGRSAVHMPGAGHEFDSLRGYVRGDDVRTIDWRASARSDELIVRTYRPERDRRVVVVLDSSRASAVRVGDETRFDAGIEAALFMAALANAGGDRVDLLALDQTVRARSSSEEKGHLLHRVATVLAKVFPRLLAADWSILPPEIAAISRQRALIVLVTPLDSGAIEEGLLPILPVLTHRHVVLVAAVADPELDEMAEQRDTPDSAFIAASAEAQKLRNRNLIQLLNRYGAEVVEAQPDDLPMAVGDAYLRLKAAGRL